MKGRVATFVPGLEDRANIGTFQSFCAQILRQHGVHLGIKPDFAIYSLDNDRRAVLEDALVSAADRGVAVRKDDVKLLGLVDRLRLASFHPRTWQKLCLNIATLSTLLRYIGCTKTNCEG